MYGCIYQRFLAAAHVVVGNIRLLLHLHEGHRRVDLRRQRDLNGILQPIHLVRRRKQKVLRLGGLLRIHEAVRSVTPTRMPSSISVGETFSPKPTTNLAIWRILMTYFVSSGPAPAAGAPGLMILLHRATCNGCSSCIICLSATRSHCDGKDN